MLSVTPVKWASKTTYLMGQQQRPHDMVGERQLNQHLACTDPPHVGTPRKWSVFTLMVRKAEPQRQVVLAPGIVLPTFMPTTECVCPVQEPIPHPLARLQRCQNWVCLHCGSHVFSRSTSGQAEPEACPGTHYLLSTRPVHRVCAYEQGVQAWLGCC